MKNFKALLPKTVWVGTLGFAAMLLGWTPSCKAQEVSPAIFTDTGVEDVYPVAKPLAKKPARVQVAAHAVQSVASNDSNERKQNAHRVARKVKVTATPGQSQGAAGTIVGTITLTPVGSATCTMEGYPVLARFSSSGASVPISGVNGLTVALATADAAGGRPVLWLPTLANVDRRQDLDRHSRT